MGSHLTLLRRIRVSAPNPSSVHRGRLRMMPQVLAPFVLKTVRLHSDERWPRARYCVLPRHLRLSLLTRHGGVLSHGFWFMGPGVAHAMVRNHRFSSFPYAFRVFLDCLPPRHRFRSFSSFCSLASLSLRFGFRIGIRGGVHRKGNIALYDEDCRSLGSSVQQVSVLMLVEGDSW